MTSLTTAELNRRTVERFLAGTHAADLSEVRVIDETVQPDVVCTGFPGGNPYDHASYKAFFEAFRSCFTNMAFVTHALVADEHRVAARFTVTVTVDHTGPFAGVEPTGRRVSFDGMVLYTMRDGKIAATALHIDQAALFTQIGALPALAA